MNEGIGIIIGAVIALVASVVTTVLQTRLYDKKRIIKEYIEQFASFYELEKLYVAEIARLRHELGSDESDKEKTIKETFRHQNEANAENVHIDYTSKNAMQFLRRF